VQVPTVTCHPRGWKVMWFLMVTCAFSESRARGMNIVRHIMLLIIQVSLREMKFKFDFLDIIQILVDYCHTKFLHLYLHYKNIEGGVTPT
jgi:hypothetical protein